MALITTPAVTSRISNFMVEGNGILLTASSSSSSKAFPSLRDGSSATDVMIINAGTVSAFVTFGTSPPTAAIPGVSAANGICILPGAIMVLSKGTATYVAAITASSTADLYFYQGYGS